MRKKLIFLLVTVFGLFLVSCGKVEVDSLNISGDTTGIVGEVINLEVEVLPEDADDKKVTWESSDEELATVTDGKVTLIKKGSVTITAKIDEVEDTHEITINDEVIETESIVVEGKSSGKVDEEITLTATISPTNASNQEVSWSSSDSSLATVNDGVVTLLAEGEVLIIATQGSISDSHLITIASAVINTEQITVEGDTEGEVGEFIDLIAEVLPTNATNQEVSWESSDEALATVTDGRVHLLGVGTVTIKAYQGEIEKTTEITITEASIKADALLVEADTDEGIVGDTINILARVEPKNATYKDVTWSSSDESIATVEEGVITLLDVGNVVITAHHRDVDEDFNLKVYEDLDFIWKAFTSSRKRRVSKQTITYYGGTTADKDLFPSVFPYRFNDEIVMDKTYMLGDDHAAHPNIDETVEWVVLHDTGNINTGARGNASFQKNQDSVSWQYTVGNDGWYQSLEDQKVSWHASSGSTRTGFTDTGIPAVNPAERTKLTIIDGYFAIKGIKTEVEAPGDQFVDVGIWPVIIDGTYHIPDTSFRKPWASSTVQYIGLDGGNYNGIGIETSVFSGSDVFITWGRTAKLVATLLINNDLKLDRVVYHNSFNNKTCPQTAIRSGNIDEWYEMIKFEYMVLKQFADYDFEFIPINTNFLDNTGRVINNPQVNNFFDYTLKITAPNGDVKQQDFRTSVE